MELSTINPGKVSSIPMIKAYLTSESKGDKILAESCYQIMLSHFGSVTSAKGGHKALGITFITMGGIAIFFSIIGGQSPAWGMVLFFLLVVVAPGCLYIKSHMKRMGILSQAYSQWKSENS